MKRQGGKIDNNGITALISLFEGNAEKAHFGSNGFKKLWEIEKNVN